MHAFVIFILLYKGVNGVYNSLRLFAIANVTYYFPPLSDVDAGIKKKASIVHIKQYRQWRHNGIAFEFGDQTYSEPNRTMMTYTEGFIKKGKEKGLKKEVFFCLCCWQPKR